MTSAEWTGSVSGLPGGVFGGCPSESAGPPAARGSAEAKDGFEGGPPSGSAGVTDDPSEICDGARVSVSGETPGFPVAFGDADDDPGGSAAGNHRELPLSRQPSHPSQ